jgi:hypothetical protein
MRLVRARFAITLFALLDTTVRRPVSALEVSSDL